MDITPYVASNDTVLCYRYCWSILRDSLKSSLSVPDTILFVMVLNVVVFIFFMVCVLRHYDKFKEYELYVMFFSGLSVVISWGVLIYYVLTL